MDSKMAFQYL